MIPASFALENRLRQKVVLLEDSLAKLAAIRKDLKSNSDCVRHEILDTFGRQIDGLQIRQQHLLAQLDACAHAKDDILSQQQDQLREALGACRQGLDCLYATVAEIRSNSAPAEVLQQQIADLLSRLSTLDIQPRENSKVWFEGDSTALRRTVNSFGQVLSAQGKQRGCESLPGELEDYDDNDRAHLMYKPLLTGPSSVCVSWPHQLPPELKHSLLKEALTGKTELPVYYSQQQHQQDARYRSMVTSRSDVGIQRLRDTSRSQSSCSKQSREPATHLDTWLHHIKGHVETEPAVFEDFEIVHNPRRDDPSTPCSYAVLDDSSLISEQDLSIEMKDVTNLFASHFQEVLQSSNSDWIVNGQRCTVAPVHADNEKWLLPHQSPSGRPFDLAFQQDQREIKHASPNLREWLQPVSDFCDANQITVDADAHQQQQSAQDVCGIQALRCANEAKGVDFWLLQTEEQKCQSQVSSVCSWLEDFKIGNVDYTYWLRKE